jgi:predicted CXXCH cytochrome family protein
VAQYETSTHYVAYLTNLGGAEYAAWTAPGGACGNCHAIDALENRVTGTVNTPGGMVANLGSGQLLYMTDGGKDTPATYTGSSTRAQVYCTTCHAVTNANDPHKTGVPWQPGSFPLVVDNDGGGTVVIEKSAQAGSAAGTQVAPDGGTNFGPGDTCMWCHRSRVDIANTLTADLDAGVGSNKITSSHWGPHEGPQVDVFSGTGGYHYNYGPYQQSTHEVSLNCVSCHMAAVSDNSNVPDHSFSPQISTCLGCHKTAIDFNVNGGEQQIQGALAELETALANLGLIAVSASPPCTPPPDVTCSFSLDQPVAGAKIDGGLLTRDQAGALYNYILVARGGGYGIHNPIYVAQLLWDSYYALTGNPMASFPNGRPHL